MQLFLPIPHYAGGSRQLSCMTHLLSLPLFFSIFPPFSPLPDEILLPGVSVIFICNLCPPQAMLFLCNIKGGGLCNIKDLGWSQPCRNTPVLSMRLTVSTGGLL